MLPGLTKKMRYKKMEFRPCIDIHNGCVKQIVGGSLKDEGNQASENFVSEQMRHFMRNFTGNRESGAVM